MLVGNPADYTLRATDPRRLSQATHSAYVKIAEGCNRTLRLLHHPSASAASSAAARSTTWSRRCERLVELGTVEINLISQDTIAYGRDRKDGTDLAKLVEAVAEVPGAALGADLLPLPRDD